MILIKIFAHLTLKKMNSFTLELQRASLLFVKEVISASSKRIINGAMPTSVVNLPLPAMLKFVWILLLTT